LQSVNIREGALGFSGGHGPLWPPLATGLGLRLQYFTERANYLSYKLIFITKRHFIDGRLIDSATLLSFRVAFRGGCDRPLWPDHEFFWRLDITFLSEFLQSQTNNVIGPMEVRPLS
jgi:hypothetical protein